MKTAPALFVLLILTGLLNSKATGQVVRHEAVFAEHRWLPGYGLRKARHPEIFQGNRKEKKYFEGWYFKIVSPGDSSILSIIPGISLSADGKEQHAFIQFIDGKTAATDYYTFPIEEFAFSKKEFAVRIGQNYFSQNGIILNIRTDSTVVSGEVQFSEQATMPARPLLNAGIMGWYRFVPFMQCYHGVVNLSNRAEGNIVNDGKSYTFNQGKGYIEKDWGSSMPSAWIWMQSNNFAAGNSSFMLSVANIPWLGKSFTGFLGFFLHEGTLHRFATNTHARLKVENSGSDTLNITVKDRRHTYLIEAVPSKAGLLKAPVKGAMDRRIAESNDTRLRLTVLDKKGRQVFSNSTQTAGFERVGNQTLLTRRIK